MVSRPLSNSGRIHGCGLGLLRRLLVLLLLVALAVSLVVVALLPINSRIALVVVLSIGDLLAPVLLRRRILLAAIVLLLLVLGREVAAATICLAGLETLCHGLEGGDTGAERSSLGLLRVPHVQLLLGLARQVLVLGGGIIFPGV